MGYLGLGSRLGFLCCRLRAGVLSLGQGPVCLVCQDLFFSWVRVCDIGFGLFDFEEGVMGG